jgi:hypothetical protein
MAQVPYDPTPSVAPQADATPYRSENVPTGAFGQGIAEATQHLGSVMQKSGDELFTRALAMQQLAQQSEANEATANYQIELGKAHAKYQSTEGKNAVDQFPDYIESTEKIRTAIGSNLSSDYARKLFDSETRSTRGRSIFNAAGHAATENKRFALGSSRARIDAAGNAALSEPEDESEFQAGLKTANNEVESQAALQGWSPEQKEQALANETSKLWVQRIQGLSKQKPFTAQKLLDKAVEDGSIKGEAIGKITDYVNKQTYTVGARQISNEVLSGNNLSFGAKPVDIKQAQLAIGQFESGGNYNARGVEVFDKAGNSRGRALGKYQVMPENLEGWLKQSGLPSMSEAEFLKSPSAQDQVFNTIFGGYMKEHGSFNEAASKWFSGRTMAEATAAGAKDANKTTVPSYLANTNAILARSAPLADKVAAAKARATELSPNDPLMADYAEARLITDVNRANAVKRDDEFNNRQAVESVLVSGGQDGKIPTSVEELKAASPEAEAAFNAMLPSDQRKYMKVLAQNAKGDTAFTEGKLRDYARLKGMAQADPAEFMSQDVVSMDLPISARKELVNLQAKLKGQAEGDPRVSRAINILKPDLQAAGVTTKDKDTYYQFVGALQDALETFQQDNKKAPPPDEVRKIGARLLQTVPGSGYFGSSWGASQMYQLPVPDDAAKIIKEDPTWAQMGITPTDEQVRRIYSRAQYQKLYGGKATPPKPSGPQAPRE